MLKLFKKEDKMNFLVAGHNTNNVSLCFGIKSVLEVKNEYGK
jgi:hypothetical protein